MATHIFTLPNKHLKQRSKNLHQRIPTVQHDTLSRNFESKLFPLLDFLGSGLQHTNCSEVICDISLRDLCSIKWLRISHVAMGSRSARVLVELFVCAKQLVRKDLCGIEERGSQVSDVTPSL
eukprot:3747793-Amphidinium_carterae.1